MWTRGSTAGHTPQQRLGAIHSLTHTHTHTHTHTQSRNHWHEVKTSPTAELIKHVSTTHTLPNKNVLCWGWWLCCTHWEHHWLQPSHSAQPSGWDMRHNTLPQRLQYHLLALPWGSNQRGLHMRRIMPACTCVDVWMNISCADPPSGGRGCFWTMALNTPPPKQCAAGGGGR